MRKLNFGYLFSIMGVVLVILLSGMAFADDLEDIETDMESTIAESDAAQSAAVATKKRELEEREATKKAKVDAIKSMAEAKSKEAAAARELKVLETKILASKNEKAKHEKLKAEAEKKIIVAQEKVAVKKTESEVVQAESLAAKSEKEAQEKILAGILDEQRKIEKQIVSDRAATKKYALEIDKLKKLLANKERTLVKLKENAKKEASKLESTKTEHDNLKRKVSSVPSKVILRSPKMDCEVIGAASDDAIAVGTIKKGTKYEVYRVIDRKWVELQIADKHGFAPKSCF